MSSRGLGRIITLVLLAACALAGGYGTMVTSFRNGFFDTLTKAVGPQARKPYIPGSPRPFKTAYTGVTAIDGQITVLVAFFCSIIHGEQTWAVTLSWWYLMAHFCAGWLLLSLEGLRLGNQQRLVRWTGIVGLIFQNASYTITVPIYLAMHVLTSPVPGSKTPELLMASAEDLGALLISVFLVFIIPLLVMCMPALAVLFPTAHYNLIAFWQAFPLWQSILQWTLKQLLTPEDRPLQQTPEMYLRAACTIYQFAIALCVGTQLGLMTIALTPASAVHAVFAKMFSEVTLQSAFLPASIWDPYTITVTGTHIPDALAPLAQSFLQWDICCGSAAIFIWAVYLYSVSAPTSSARKALTKTLLWGLLGGPIAAAAAFLWERDEQIIKSSGRKKNN